MSSKVKGEQYDMTTRGWLLAYLRRLPRTQLNVLWEVASQLKGAGPEAMAYLYGAVDQVGDETMHITNGATRDWAISMAKATAEAVGRLADPMGERYVGEGDPSGDAVRIDGAGRVG